MNLKLTAQVLRSSCNVAKLKGKHQKKVGLSGRALERAVARCDPRSHILFVSQDEGAASSLSCVEGGWRGTLWPFLPTQIK